MALYWSLFLVVTAGSLLVSAVHLLPNEPVCSKFDYEEKVLEKMIRTEIRVEQMFEEMRRAKETITATVNDVKQELENMKKNGSTFEAEMELKMSTFSENFERESLKIAALKDPMSTPTVAFSARRTGSTEVYSGSGARIVFNDVVLNAADGYNSATGIFTAPLSGLYYFTSQMCDKKGHSLYFGIVVSDNTLASSTQMDNDFETCSSVNTVAVLTANERVWIKSTSDSRLYQSDQRWNSFAGALLNT